MIITKNSDKNAFCDSYAFFEQPSRQPLLIYITQQDDRQRHCEAEGRGNPGRFIKDLEKTMTAIELQKSSSLGHVQASLAVTLAHRVFENISKQYRLGLVSTGTLSHDLNRF